ncbi:SPOSA6832_01561, partial [Sporobolomyces salmonicolor]
MPTDDASYQELIDRIHYSERYSDDEYEYRHVQLPRQMLKLSESAYFEPDSNVLRLLTEDEWRGIGISLGWEHYEVHHPEPHILLFRREKDYQAKYGNAQR